MLFSLYSTAATADGPLSRGCAAAAAAVATATAPSARRPFLGSNERRPRDIGRGRIGGRRRSAGTVRSFHSALARSDGQRIECECVCNHTRTRTGERTTDRLQQYWGFIFTQSFEILLHPAVERERCRLLSGKTMDKINGFCERTP